MTDYLSHFKPTVRKNFDKVTAWLDFNGIGYRTAFATGPWSDTIIPTQKKRFELIIEDRLLCLDHFDLERVILEDVAKQLRVCGYNLVKRTAKKNTDKRQKSLFDN